MRSTINMIQTTTFSYKNDCDMTQMLFEQDCSATEVATNSFQRKAVFRVLNVIKYSEGKFLTSTGV